MKEAAQPLQLDGLRTKARLPHADIGSDGEDVAAASAHGLMTGALELWQLSPGLQQLYALGFHHGRASLQPRLAQAEHEAALAYERLHNPGKKFTEMVNRRVSQAAEANASEPNAWVFYERVLAAACTPRGGAA